MSTDIIETLKQESTDLDLHVQLCEQRYLQLISRLDNVDKRLDKIDTILTEIKDNIVNKETATYEKYLGWGGTVIFVLATALIGIFTKVFFFK